MNLYLKISIIFVFLASTFGCNKKTSFENLNTINIEASSITNLSEIIEEIEYVLIEKPNVPINQIDKFFILNDGYLIADTYGNSVVLKFDMLGNFINQIGNYGEGPEEYLQIADVDLFNDYVIFLSADKLLTYSIDGKYLHSEMLDFRPYRFLHSDSSHYLFFIPESMAIELKNKQNDGVLFSYNKGSKESENLIKSIFPKTFNFMGEKNNLFKNDKEILFSTSFCDTIYTIENGNIAEKYALNFGKSQINLSTLYGLDIHQMVSKINSSAFDESAIHIPHLFQNKNFLITAFRKNKKFDFLIYDKKTDRPYLTSKLKNDLDQGPDIGIIKGIDDDYLYAFREPEEFDENQFSKLISADLANPDRKEVFWVLSKYKLKK